MRLVGLQRPRCICLTRPLHPWTCQNSRLVAGPSFNHLLNPLACLPAPWLYINIPSIKEITTPDVACCLQTAGCWKHLCIEWEMVSVHPSVLAPPNDPLQGTFDVPFSHTSSKQLKTQQPLLFGSFTLMMLFWWQNRWRGLTLKPTSAFYLLLNMGKSLNRSELQFAPWKHREIIVVFTSLGAVRIKWDDLYNWRGPVSSTASTYKG